MTATTHSHRFYKPTTYQAGVSRFRHITPEGIIFVGEVEVAKERGEFGEEYTDVTITECWRIDSVTPGEVHVYDKEFPAILRRDIVQTALEQRMTPPVCPIELPSDWEAFEVLDQITRYTISASMALPTVRTRMEARAHGLVAVRRIQPLGNKYTVEATGSLDEIRSELRRIKHF